LQSASLVVACLGSHSAGYRPKGGDPAMTTQVTSKGGFANNFWLQTAVLVVGAFLIALAAKFVW
jgi:hypothetical protein